MITVEDVTYAYPGQTTPAVDCANLNLSGAELTLVAGVSGGGKSTLLRTINGLVPHYYGGRFSGRVMVDGIDTARTRPRDLASSVGFVGQDPEDHAVAGRVEDDIAFTLENLGTDSATMRRRVEEVLDALALSDLRSRRLDTLSGGERQRVAIASALVAMPAHLVLDEPTSQLDPQSAEEVIGALLRLRDEIGISVILAEHRLERVLQYAQRLIVLDQGRVHSGDPVTVLLDRDLGPPVMKLGRALGWRHLPLSLREARLRLQGAKITPPLPAKSPPTGDTVVSASGVAVELGGRRVLGPLEVSIAEGETVVMMGRNGSGKTTLLRVLAGLVKAGRVTRPKAIAFVPQNPAKILFRATVSEEIAATLRGRGLPHSQGDVTTEAGRFRVGHLLANHPRDLSGGEATAVAFAAASAGNPKLVLLDEPTRGMDDPAKLRLAELLKGWRNEGRAVIMATHDVELAARVATRVMILAEGEIVADGVPAQTLAGSMTFSTQMNKVFGDPRILTVEDATAALGIV